MILLCVFLCLACYYDYRHTKIPNWLNLIALLHGLALAFWDHGILGCGTFLVQGTIVVLFFYPLFRIGTIGAGDLKLFGVCCGFLPRERILYFLFFALLFAAIGSFIRFTRREDVIERLCYFVSYIREVADKGEWQLYWQDVEEKKKASVCLAGPVLLSMVMYVGGLY